MDKLIITRWRDKVLTMGEENGKTISLDLQPDNDSYILGNIYIGKVKNIAKNIDAAFVDIGNGQMGYLSLDDAFIHYASSGRGDGKLRSGDEIIVQVEREAVKTKAPVLTGNLNFTGRYCVVTAGKNQLGFSSKITDRQWKAAVRPYLEALKKPDFGIIIRTNALGVDFEEITAEAERLIATCRKVLDFAASRTCYSLLYKANPPYLSGIRDSFSDSLTSIITDERDIYESIREYLEQYLPQKSKLLKYYDDDLLPLSKLARVEKEMTEALGKRVWLKSGGYLVVEPTEALCVIDVNTGKYTGKKNPHDTIMKINLEAAAEVGRQLRLRNISGIIIVDFIDMDLKEDQELLLKKLTKILSDDPVKTNVVEITKLNLVEITRKKVRKPLYEEVALVKEREEP